MTTEGTYPYVQGGVSVWCDRLIRKLPDIEFSLYSIAPGVGKQPTWDLPDNVVALTPIDLSPSTNQVLAHYSYRLHTQFLDAFDGLLTAVIGTPENPIDTFLSSVRALEAVAQEMPLSVGFQSDLAFDLLRNRWMYRRVGDRLDFMGRPSLFDVLEVSSALARYFVPLSLQIDADVVHTTANGLCSLPALSAKWNTDTPILLTEHGVYLRERFIEAHKIKGGDRAKGFLLLFFGVLNAAVLQVADRIAPVSEYNARWERETGADSSKITTIYNGVDPSMFPEITSEPDMPTVSWVGRIDPLKDVVTLIESFEFVKREIPEAKLRLFGPIPDGNGSYHKECVATVVRCGLGDSVTFEGPISPVNAAFEAGHVIALSSISEGFPFTVIEAMMSGRATVSTDVGGVAEAVGDAGVLVPPRDSKEMGKAMVELLRNDRQRRSLGTAARKRALSHLTLDLMADQYRDLYTAMSRGSRSSGPRSSDPRQQPADEFRLTSTGKII